MYYSVNPIMVLAALTLKKKRHISLCTICSELPQYRNAGNKISFPRKVNLRIQQYLNRKMDKYILFSKHMAESIPVENKPSIVLEGIAPDIQLEPIIQKKNVVMYAGGLGKQNNIRVLIDACKKSSIVDELWIAGQGEELAYLKNQTDKRIRYLGVLNGEEVISLSSGPIKPS